MPKPLDPNTDITTTRTALHEAIPITGSIMSGTYNELNIKNFTHGQFQSVYDYPYLSSSANHIFDLTIGYHSSSPLSASTSEMNAKKINMYTEMAQTLLGYTGSAGVVRQFENDLSLDLTGTMNSGFFIALSRQLVKDEIKKGTFSLGIGTGSWTQPFGGGGVVQYYQDISASANGDNTSVTLGGDYGILYNTRWPITSGGFGVIFYQTGIVFLSSSIFTGDSLGNNQFACAEFWDEGGSGDTSTPIQGVTGAFTGSSVSSSCDAFRHRIYNMSFQNTVDINSTVYFCRANHNDFNYSSNPTYLSASQLVVKSVATDTPVTYITTIGLYNAANELLATAKLSEPLKKDPNNELTIRVRLDY